MEMRRAGKIQATVNNTFSDGLNLDQALTKVRCPPLLRYGDMELVSIIPETEVDFLKLHIPHMVTCQFKNAGHSPHWEQTEATLTYINNFLAQVE